MAKTKKITEQDLDAIIPKQIDDSHWTDNARQLLKKRYFLKDKDGNPIEDIRAWLIRVSVAVANAELQWHSKKDTLAAAKRFFIRMLNQEFMPNTPCLANAGKREQMLSACFAYPIEDDMQSIYKTLTDTALTLKMGGGVGFNFSHIRPEGSLVSSTGGGAGGPLMFMGVFNESAGVVKQGGMRHGAHLAILEMWHPDIEKFIHCKDDTTELTNFNISVGISDEFMTAVQDGLGWDLIDPNTKQVVKTVDARTLFNEVIEHAHATGEPGVIFLDTINSGNNLPLYGDIDSCNPCIGVSAPILTPDGIRTIGDLKIGDIIWSKSGWTNVVNKVMTGVKPIYRFRTSAGSFIGTDNHRIIQNGKKVEVRDAESIDILAGYDGPVEIDPQDVMDGMVIGDGSRHSGKVVLTIGIDDGDYFTSPIKDYIGNKRGNRHSIYAVTTTVKTYELEPLPERVIPDRFKYGSASKVAGFLRGLYTANGSVKHVKTKSGKRNSYRVTLKATSLKLIDDVQLMLSSIGIKSYVTVNHPRTINWHNGTYTSKLSYDINILNDVDIFARKIGFVQQYKNNLLKEILEVKNFKVDGKLSYTIKDREYLGDEEVYDITVDNESHTYWTGGLNVANCGELPLFPYESCNINSINLTKVMSDDPNEVIDYVSLAGVIHDAVRFLDDVIDVNNFPISEVAEVTKANRKIGLGVMGFADLLMMKGIPYGSERCIEIAQDLSRFMFDTAKDVSRELAKERGVFPNYLLSNWHDDDIKIRNAALCCVAPTGSVSILANCSASIEPLYAVAFRRNILEGTEMFEENPIFKKTLQDRGLYSKELIAQIADSPDGTITGLGLPSDIEQTFKTAHSVTYQEHIAVQAAFQSWFDSSISKTINMVESATVQDIYNAYFTAWKNGCKGCTVYRNGSRTGQPMSTGKKKENDRAVANKEEVLVVAEPMEVSPAKRAKILNGVTEVHKVGACGSLYVTVNKDDNGNVVEIMAATGRASGCASLVSSLCRVISVALRSGISVDPILEQLVGIRCTGCIADNGTTVLSCPDAIGRTIKDCLKQYNRVVLDAVARPTVPVCDECGSIMIFNEGCYHCSNPSCAVSKCS